MYVTIAVRNKEVCSCQATIAVTKGRINGPDTKSPTWLQIQPLLCLYGLGVQGL